MGRLSPIHVLGLGAGIMMIAGSIIFLVIWFRINKHDKKYFNASSDRVLLRNSPSCNRVLLRSQSSNNFLDAVLHMQE